MGGACWRAHLRITPRTMPPVTPEMVRMGSRLLRMACLMSLGLQEKRGRDMAAEVVVVRPSVQVEIVGCVVLRGREKLVGVAPRLRRRLASGLR